MSLQQQLAEQGVEWRLFEHDDQAEFVADFGPREHSAVDVVGETVIVIVDDDQYEFDTEADPRAFMNNGVLTIEVDE